MGTRCKFKCVAITDTVNGCKVQLEPVTHGSPENEQFFHFTPYGNFEMGLIQADVAHKLFWPGKEYYIDISPA